MQSINQLWKMQKDLWKQENEHFFGITPLHDWAVADEVSKHLKECADKLWNNGTNELKELLANGRCNDIDKMVPGSWELVYDQSELICLYATFQWNVDSKDSENGLETITKRAPIAYLPVPDDLCWYLGESRYVLRISAVPQYGLLYRIDDIVYYQKAWSYSIKKKKFAIYLDGLDPFEDLTALNRDFISKIAGCEPETLNNQQFLDALPLIPEMTKHSIFGFKFTRVDGMFDLVKRSKRFANPIMKVAIPINVVKMFTAVRVRNDAMNRKGSNNLILATSDLFALENSRTVIYKNEFNSGFMFADAERFFDAFKTGTNKSAGKSRLLLDDTLIKEGKLWSDVWDGDNHIGLRDMYEIMLHPEWSVKKNLSVISSSNFGNNNAPKRIMMTAKLRAQAVPVDGENDPFTHEVQARIVFGDFEGYNYGDSIIICRSFARKLRSVKKTKIHIGNHQLWHDVVSRYQIGDMMSVNDLTLLSGSTQCNNMRNIKILDINTECITVKGELPFSVGDKLTNLHGSKGICSMILEDWQMPALKNDLGLMKAGPFDVIVSGLSVYRRKSLGQLFEAWSKATGHDDVDDIITAVKLYSDEMQEFSDNSVVVFNGLESIKPLGINSMLRLNHDAVGKQSHSYVKSNYARNLKIGEMELLNLACRGMNEILNEMDIRSISKHHNALQQIKDVQKDGELLNQEANYLRFFNLMRAAGFDFNLRHDDVDHLGGDVSKLAQTCGHDVSLLHDEPIQLFKV